VWNPATGRAFGPRAVILAALAGCHAGSACGGCFANTPRSAKAEPSSDSGRRGHLSPTPDDEKSRTEIALLLYAAELARPLTPQAPDAAVPRDVEAPAAIEVPEASAAPPPPDGSGDIPVVLELPPDDAGGGDDSEPSISPDTKPEIVSTGGAEPDAEPPPLPPPLAPNELDASAVPPQVIYVPFYFFPQLPLRPGR
jgi:hypothetical protein